MTSATSWARAALNSSASARGVDRAGRRTPRSRSSARTRSPSGVPPGSRVSRTTWPRPPSSSASRRASTVLPAPSGPSSVMNVPLTPGSVGPIRRPCGTHPRSGSRSAGTLPNPNARPDRPRPRHRGAARRDLRRRPRRSPPRRVDLGQERPRRGRRDGRDRRASASASSSTARGASPPRTRSSSPRPTASARWRSGSPRRRRRRSGARVELDGRPPATGTFETPVDEDPFKIPLERKISDLVDADRAAGEVKGVTFTESMYSGHREWKTFAATDGSFTEQVITQVGTAVEANAIEGDEHQRRSYPDAGGGYQAGGLRVRPRPRPRSATPSRSARRRSRCSPRRSARPGTRTIVLDPSMLYLQIHESCGHPTELDRVFGTEASYAGTSFLTPDKLDDGLQYGSELVTIVADATAPGGLGHVRLGRRGRRGAGRAARPERPVRRLPLLPRDGAAGRACSPAARCAPTAGTGSR